jgi:hypothetical protein
MSGSFFTGFRPKDEAREAIPTWHRKFFHPVIPGRCEASNYGAQLRT